MDLTQLITTIVTATAALTAIVGGFLISRVITLSSEQSGIKRKLGEISIDIKAKERLYIEAEKNLLEEDREDFIYAHFKDLIFEEKPLEMVMKNQGGIFQERSAKELEPVVDEINRINSSIKKMFEEQGIIYSNDLPGEFSDFSTLASKKLEGRKSWYELLYDEYAYILPKRPKGRQPGLLNNLDTSFSLSPSLYNIQS